MVIVVPNITWWLFIPWFKTTNRKFLVFTKVRVDFTQETVDFTKVTVDFTKFFRLNAFCWGTWDHTSEISYVFPSWWGPQNDFLSRWVTKKRTKNTQSSTRATQNSKATWVTQDGLCPGATVDGFSCWWLNQPLWKIWCSQIGSSLQVGMKIKNIWVATT